MENEPVFVHGAVYWCRNRVLVLEVILTNRLLCSLMNHLKCRNRVLVLEVILTLPKAQRSLLAEGRNRVLVLEVILTF